jgi:hypothetical protein
VSCPCCTPPSEYRRFFNRRVARLETRRFRRRGLPRSARGLVSLAGDAGGASVLDVGGGTGTLSLELRDRVERRVGDFVVESGLVEPHDLVTLHRVVCCYPDAGALVAAAATHAKRRLLLTYPRERRLTRLGFRVVNLWLRLTRCGFRTYVHPVAAMEEAAAGAGLRRIRREAQGLFWENAAFERSADVGSAL